MAIDAHMAAVPHTADILREAMEPYVGQANTEDLQVKLREELVKLVGMMPGVASVYDAETLDQNMVRMTIVLNPSKIKITLEPRDANAAGTPAG